MKLYSALLLLIIGFGLPLYAMEEYNSQSKEEVKHESKKEKKSKRKHRKHKHTKSNKETLGEEDTSKLSDGRPHSQCYWVVPDRLLAGRFPKGKKLQQCLDAGVTFFLNLTENHELEQLEEKASKQGSAIKHIRMPIKDHATPDLGYMKKILDTIDDALEEGHKVYVHCAAGRGRTGTVIGCYLVRKGMTGSEALIHLAKCRASTNHPGQDLKSPRRKTQRDYVENYSELF